MEAVGDAVARGAVQSVQPELPALVQLLTSCSDPTRLRLLVAVHAAPGAAVKDLALATGLAANTVTQALGALRAVGALRRVREGRLSRWYLDDDVTHALLHHLGAPHSALHPDHA